MLYRLIVMGLEIIYNQVLYKANEQKQGREV